MRQSRKAKAAPATTVGQARDAQGVTYLEDAAAPGLKFFRCEPYRATLSVKGCGARWAGAQSAPATGVDTFATCRGCPIGAAHAGHDHIRYSRLYGAEICPRCGKGGMRMIGNKTCVSCYNRSREIASGRNARGNAPVELLQRAPHVIEFRLACDARPDAVRVVATGLTEAVIQTLRTTKGELAFGFSRPVELSQRRLF